MAASWHQWQHDHARPPRVSVHDMHCRAQSMRACSPPTHDTTRTLHDPCSFSQALADNFNSKPSCMHTIEYSSSSVTRRKTQQHSLSRHDLICVWYCVVLQLAQLNCFPDILNVICGISPEQQAQVTPFVPILSGVAERCANYQAPPAITCPDGRIITTGIGAGPAAAAYGAGAPAAEAPMPEMGMAPPAALPGAQVPPATP